MTVLFDPARTVVAKRSDTQSAISVLHSLNLLTGMVVVATLGGVTPRKASKIDTFMPPRVWI